MFSPPLETFPPKTPTYSNIYSRRGTRSAAALFTFSLIPGTPSTAFSTLTTPTSTENIRIYLAITTFIYVNIVYK